MRLSADMSPHVAEPCSNFELPGNDIVLNQGPSLMALQTRAKAGWRFGPQLMAQAQLPPHEPWLRLIGATHLSGLPLSNTSA